MGTQIPDFVPTLPEIYSRGEALRWFQLMDWPDTVIDSIMLDDDPEIDVVRRMVYDHGPDAALNRLRRFLGV